MRGSRPTARPSGVSGDDRDRDRAAGGRCSSEVLARAADPEQWERFERQLRSTGYCRRPVRLRGRVDAIDAATGEVAHVVLDRARAGRDAAEVLRQPARGGLPVVRARPTAATRSSSSRPGCAAARACPRPVAEHPMVFADADGAELRAGALAPGRSTARRGAAGRAATASVCPHGVSVACGEVHDEDDPRLGEPLCAECFDYEHAVLWNALAPELWRRTAIQIPRELARLTGVAARSCAARARVVREGRRVPAPRRAALPLRAPARRASAERRRASSRRRPSSARELLIDAARAAVAARVGALPAPDERRRAAGSRRRRREIRWGAQVEVRELDARRPARRRRARATSRSTRRSRTEAVGGLMYRLEASDLERLRVRPHVRRLRRVRVAARRRARTCTSCGCGGGRTRSASAGTASPRAAATRRRSRRCARRGTSTQLRRRTRRARDPWGRPVSEGASRERRWRTAGSGYRTLGDAWLAESGASARARAAGGA